MKTYPDNRLPDIRCNTYTNVSYLVVKRHILLLDNQTSYSLLSVSRCKLVRITGYRISGATLILTHPTWSLNGISSCWTIRPVTPFCPCREENLSPSSGLLVCLQGKYYESAGTNYILPNLALPLPVPPYPSLQAGSKIWIGGTNPITKTFLPRWKLII